MKNLIFLMMAILLINVSFAGEVGEDLKGDCVDSPQHSRSQEVLSDDALKTSSKEDSAATATSK